MELFATIHPPHCVCIFFPQAIWPQSFVISWKTNAHFLRTNYIIKYMTRWVQLCRRYWLAFRSNAVIFGSNSFGKNYERSLYLACHVCSVIVYCFLHTFDSYEWKGNERPFIQLMGLYPILNVVWGNTIVSLAYEINTLQLWAQKLVILECWVVCIS
jgi:hypothetical protein